MRVHVAERFLRPAWQNVRFDRFTALAHEVSENQDSGTVSGSESTLRTVSSAHVLQEAKSERASSQGTSPSVAAAQAVVPASFTHPARNASSGSAKSINTAGGCGFPLRSALRVISASHFIQENICTS